MNLEEYMQQVDERIADRGVWAAQYGLDGVDLSVINGETLVGIEGLHKDSDRVVLRFASGFRVVMHHRQDCCETVEVADFDLVPIRDGGERVVTAYEAVQDDDGERPREYIDSWTWTFYHIRTERQDIMIRWLGESNGYYSESVDWYVERVSR